MNFREVATGLQFPEGPIAMRDGSVVLVEIEAGALTRVTPAGRVERIALLGGGPNGAAIEPPGCRRALARVNLDPAVDRLIPRASA